MIPWYTYTYMYRELRWYANHLRVQRGMVSGLVTWSGGVFTNVYLAESDSNRELYFFLEFLRFYRSSRVLLTSVQTLAIKASCFVDGVNCCLESKLLMRSFLYKRCIIPKENVYYSPVFGYLILL